MPWQAIATAIQEVEDVVELASGPALGLGTMEVGDVSWVWVGFGDGRPVDDWRGVGVTEIA